jgi:hypothetical protein
VDFCAVLFGHQYGVFKGMIRVWSKVGRNQNVLVGRQHKKHLISFGPGKGFSICSILPDFLQLAFTG